MNSNSITQTISECSSYTWIDGITYNESNSNATYIQYGIDSICADTFYLELTILPESESQSNVTNCDSFEWNGTTYNESGTYAFNTTNEFGCDSVATLNLTINISSSSTTNISACESYFGTTSCIQKVVFILMLPAIV